MDKPSTHIETKDWQQLNDLLQVLEEDQLLTELTLYPQIFTIAEGSKTPRDMRFRLAALLCQNEEQQHRFYVLFDAIFPEVIQLDLVQAGLSEADITFKFEKPSIKTSSKKVNPKPSKNENVPTSTTKDEEGSRIDKALLVLTFLLATILAVSLFYSNTTIDRTVYTTYILLAGVGIIYIIRRFFRRSKPILELGQDDTPEQFRNLHLPDYQLVQFGRGFKKLSTQLRERELSEIPIFDVNNTVRKTIRAGGIFQPQYRFKTEPPSYLVLIDYTIPNNHRTRIAEMLHRWLKDQMVPVSRFYYRNDPRHCWNENNPKGLPLQKLAQTYAKERLLVFGDGWAFLHPLEAGLAKWAHTLLNWEERAIVTPINPRQWSQREVFLSQYFQLVPASEDGLQVVNAYYKTKGQVKAEEHIWEGEPVEEIRLEHFEEDLAKTLPEPELRAWLAALSCFPKLHWKLTLHLGELISKKTKQDLLQFEYLRKLSRLSWFYNGFFPRAVREKLYRSLSEDRKRLVHTEIYKWLQKEGQKEIIEQNDQSSFELQLALQKLAAGLSSSAEKKELQKTITRDQYLQITLSDNPEEYDTAVPEELLANLPSVQRQLFWRDLWKKTLQFIAVIGTTVSNRAEEGVQTFRGLAGIPSNDNEQNETEIQRLGRINKEKGRAIDKLKKTIKSWKKLEPKVLVEKAWQLDQLRFYIEKNNEHKVLEILLKWTDTNEASQIPGFSPSEVIIVNKEGVLYGYYRPNKIFRSHKQKFSSATNNLLSHTDDQIQEVLPSIDDLKKERLRLLEVTAGTLSGRRMDNDETPFFAFEIWDFVQILSEILISPYNTSSIGGLEAKSYTLVLGGILASTESTRFHKTASSDLQPIHLAIRPVIETYAQIRKKPRAKNVDLLWQELGNALRLLSKAFMTIENPHTVIFYHKTALETSGQATTTSTQQTVDEIRKHIATGDLREALATIISLPELDNNDSYILAVSEMLADLHTLETDLAEQLMASRGRPVSPLRAKTNAAILDLAKSIEDNIDEKNEGKNTINIPSQAVVENLESYIEPDETDNQNLASDIGAIRELLSANDLAKVVEATAALIEDYDLDDYRTESISLSTRFERLEREVSKGIITNEDYNIQVSQLTHRLVNFLNFLEDSAQIERTPKESFEEQKMSSAQELEEIESEESEEGTTKILFLNSNPFDSGSIQMSTERSRISNRLQKESYPEKFVLNIRHTPTIAEFAKALYFIQSDIIHFSGHGNLSNSEIAEIRKNVTSQISKSTPGSSSNKNLGISLLGEEKNLQFISPSFLGNIFEVATKKMDAPINLVIFSGCYAEEQAKAVAEFVPYVVGVSFNVSDTAAIAFTKDFYSTIAQNMSVESAFNYGVTNVLVSGEPEDHFILYINGEKNDRPQIVA